MLAGVVGEPRGRAQIGSFLSVLLLPGSSAPCLPFPAGATAPGDTIHGE